VISDCDDQRSLAGQAAGSRSRLFRRSVGCHRPANSFWAVDRRGPAGRRRPQGAGRSLASTSSGSRTATRILLQANNFNKLSTRARRSRLGDDCDPLPHTQSFPLTPLPLRSPNLLHLCAVSTSSFDALCHHHVHISTLDLPRVVAPSLRGRSWMVRRVGNADGQWETTPHLLRCFAASAWPWPCLARENHHNPPHTHWWDGRFI
jgi:hypothetical protein